MKKEESDRLKMPPPAKPAKSQRKTLVMKDFRKTYDHPLGPFRLAQNRGKGKLHLLGSTDRAIGCPWKYKVTNGEIITNKE